MENLHRPTSMTSVPHRTGARKRAPAWRLHPGEIESIFPDRGGNDEESSGAARRGEGQGIFDRVVATKVKADDWMRMGRVYLEANEWDKAKAAFDKALALDPKDQGNLTAIGAWYNLTADRQTAEELVPR